MVLIKEFRHYCLSCVTVGIVCLIIFSDLALAAAPPAGALVFNITSTDCFGEDEQSRDSEYKSIPEDPDGCQSYGQDLYENLNYKGSDGPQAACADIQTFSVYTGDTTWFYFEYDMAGEVSKDICSSMNLEMELDYLDDGLSSGVRIPDLYVQGHPADCGLSWTDAMDDVDFKAFIDANNDMGGDNPRVGDACDLGTYPLPAGCSDFDIKNSDGYETTLGEPADQIYCRRVGSPTDKVQIAIRRSFDSAEGPDQEILNPVVMRPFSNQSSSIGPDKMFWHDWQKQSDMDGANIDNLFPVSLIEEDPTAEVEKTADPTSVTSGGSVTFSVVVSNTSNNELTLTTLDDDIHLDITTSGHDGITSTTCGTAGPGTLPHIIAGGGSYSCEFTATLTGSGQETDTVTATLTCAHEDCPLTPSDDATVTINLPVVPNATLTKSATPSAVPETGDQVVFDVVVQNTGNTSLTLNSLLDDVYGDITSAHDDITSTGCLVPQTIAVADSYSCSFTVAVVSGDFDSGFPGDDCDVGGQKDIVTAGFAVLSDRSDDACVEFLDVPPSAGLVKTADPTEVDGSGSVTFSVTVTNTSKEELTLNDLDDTIYGDITLAAGDITATTCDVPQTLQPAGETGDNYDCTFTATVDLTGLASETDTVTATLVDDEGNEVDPSDDATVFNTAGVTVVKSANPSTVPETGGQVVFTVSITAVTPFTVNSLTDSIYNDLTTSGHDGITATTCTTGQKVSSPYICTFTVASVSGDYDPDFVEAECTPGGERDVVTANVDPANGDAVDRQDDACVQFEDVLPVAEVDKTADPTEVDLGNGPVNVTFTVIVTNNSTERLFLSALVDDIYGDITSAHDDIVSTDCDLITSIWLDPDESVECAFVASTFFLTASQTDTVTATLSDDDDNEITPNDDAVVTNTADVTMEKLANPDTVPETGGQVVFTVSIAAAVPFTVDSPLTDSIYGDITSVHDEITATTCTTGEKVTSPYTCTFTVASVSGNYDLDFLEEECAPGGERDVVTATIDPANDDQDVYQADACVEFEDVLPTAQVVKTADPTVVDGIGEVTFSVTVTNTSEEELTLDDLVDTIYGDITSDAGDITTTTCAVPQTLEPTGETGDSYDCTFTATVDLTGLGSETDIVTATLSDDDGNQIVPFDDATVFQINGIAVFRVIKDFDDDNPMGVEVFIRCNDGHLSPSEQGITDGEENGVNFVVDLFTNGGLECDVWEEQPIDGYTASYTASGDSPSYDDNEGCHFVDVEVGDENLCVVFNEADDAIFKVHKWWEVISDGGDLIPQDATIKISCDGEIVGGTKPDECFNDNHECIYEIEGSVTITAELDTSGGPVTCVAEEIGIIDDAIEVDDADCDEHEIDAGKTDSCTITNTVFFEGIPSLNRYSLALLALLMLGMGAVGLRRFA